MKWAGKVGYITTEETSPGVWTETKIERKYYGDIVRNTRRWDSSDKQNDDLHINNEISIVSDPYAMNNFHSIRYIDFMGTKWKVVTVEVQYPRLRLVLGEEYNG